MIIVNGGWGDWRPFGECSQTCGDDSIRHRTRPCDNPAPKNGGNPCIGRGSEAQHCVKPLCPKEAPGSGNCGDDEDSICEVWLQFLLKGF